MAKTMPIMVMWPSTAILPKITIHKIIIFHLITPSNKIIFAIYFHTKAKERTKNLPYYYNIVTPSPSQLPSTYPSTAQSTFSTFIPDSTKKSLLFHRSPARPSTTAAPPHRALFNHFLRLLKLTELSAHELIMKMSS